MAVVRLRGRRLQKLRKLVFLRDHHQCQLNLSGCTGRAEELDHKIPLMHGGTDSMENLQAACSNCNRSKGGVLLAANGTGDVGSPGTELEFAL